MSGPDRLRRAHGVIGLFLILAFYAGNTLIAHRGLMNLGSEPFSLLGAAALPEAHAWACRPNVPALLDLCRNHFDYPPGYLLTSAFIIRALGKHWLTMVLLHNTAYLLLLLAGTFLLGRRLLDEKAGACAALLVACYPPVYGTYQLFSMDFALMGVTVWSIYLLYRCDFFRRTGWSVVCGLVCGWGMMVKEPFAAFLAGPLLYAGWRVLGAARRKDFRPLLNALVFIALGAAVMAPYYAFHTPAAPLQAAPPQGAWPWLRSLRLVTLGLWENLLTPPFFLLFLAGCWRLRRDGNGRDKFVLSSWILVSSAIVALMPQHKSPRYLIPQLPALALVSAYGLRAARGRRYGRLLPAAIALVGAAHYYAITYGIGLNLDRNAFSNGISYFKYYYEKRDTNPTRSFLRAQEAMMKDAVPALQAKLASLPPPRPNRPLRLLALVGECPGFNETSLDLALWFHDSRLRSAAYPILSHLPAYQAVLDAADRADFAVQAVPWYGVDFRDDRFFAQVRGGYANQLDPPRPPSEPEWRRAEHAWNALRRRFQPLGVVLRAPDCDLHLYRIRPARRSP